MDHDHKRQTEERHGPAFDQAMLLEARWRTRQLIARIAAHIRPAMAEEEALAFARATLKVADMLRGWHGIHVRFGRNTLKNFGEPSEPGVILRDNDIFFIDIGPVWQGYEGDGGETFTVGNDPDMQQAAADVRGIFDAAADHWRQNGATGMALYDFAATETARRGWTLNLNMSGHRLSDFPHSIKHKGPLIAANYTPSAAAWVLEIQIRHPTKPFSAFYEDLLLA